MEPPSPWSSERQTDSNNGEGNTQKLPAVRVSSRTRTIDQNFIAALDTMEVPSISGIDADTMDNSQFRNITKDKFANVDTQDTVEQSKTSLIDKADTLETACVTFDTSIVANTSIMENIPPTPEDAPIDALDTGKVAIPPIQHVQDKASIDKLSTQEVSVPETPLPERSSDAHHAEIIDKIDTRVVEVVVPEAQKKSTKPLISYDPTSNTANLTVSPQHNHTLHTHPSLQQAYIKRGTAILLMAFLAIIVLRAFTFGPTNFLGSQGWASVIGGPASIGDPNLLKNINTQLHKSTTPGTGNSTKTQMTPQQYIDLIVNKMTLDQKLGQMMIVQFTGATYDLPISTMISQYNIGSVLIFSANGNIVNKDQLSSLIKQMKDNSHTIPLAVAIDQEGGTVDRLIDLDGPRPAAATIGATNDPTQAKLAGIQAAQDLASYGFNLNLAPVVDVTNVYNAQLYNRTYGNTPQQVTKMAAAYLQGLQQSGKVVGTLKHFPGLGDVGTDPHIGIPYLNRAQSDLEQIDWAPYRALIQQGNVHAIMVTHEIVSALDKTEPSSLSSKIIQGILRKDLGFQGVIMTDSLTMDALTAYAPSEAQAAVMSIEAGSDLIMGAGSPEAVASMFQEIKQAINTGALTEQRINDSVRRVLMMKYTMGLLPIPKN